MPACRLILLKCRCKVDKRHVCREIVQNKTPLCEQRTYAQANKDSGSEREKESGGAHTRRCK